MLIRELFIRPVNDPIEGVVKVYDQGATRRELDEFVVTSSIEKNLKDFLDAFSESLDARRARAGGLDGVGVWVSGFFGSGKSHLAKVIGSLLANPVLDEVGARTAHDIFLPHLEGARLGGDIRRRLAEVRAHAAVRCVSFEINARQTLNSASSITEIMLSAFYESVGLSRDFVVARIEQELIRAGRYDALGAECEKRRGRSWDVVRNIPMLVGSALEDLLPVVWPEAYPDTVTARRAVDAAFRRERLTTENFAKELVAWVDAQQPSGARLQHLVFVIDEVGQFIGGNAQHIEELRAIVEMLGVHGRGKVWVVATSQQDLASTVGHAGLQLDKLGKLDARFIVKLPVMADQIERVVGDRILAKRPAHHAALDALFQREQAGWFALADLKSTRVLATLDVTSFRTCYPLLPHQIKLAQDIFEALSGFRISGGVRSMIGVTQEVVSGLADVELGEVAAFDRVFDAIEPDLLSQEYLGASGVQAIREAVQRVPATPVDPSRVLKVLWLVQRVTFVPRSTEALARLLASRGDVDLAALRNDVEATLQALQVGGYVARDEATGEYKFLNEKERTLEQEVQRVTGTLGLGPIASLAKEVLKSEVLKKTRLNGYQVAYGASQTLFGHDLSLDGEDLATGQPLAVAVLSPVGSKKKDREEADAANRQSAAKGRVVWIVGRPLDGLEGRLKRAVAIAKVLEDDRFTKEAAVETRNAVADKTREGSALRASLARELERSLLEGRVLFAGQEQELDGKRDLKTVLETAFRSVIPNVFTRFANADRKYDASNVKKYLVGSQKNLQQVDPALDLFDAQEMLRRDSTLVATLLEVVKDRADEAKPNDGAALVAFFEARPFGWPADLVRLLLAACFRGGALYLDLPHGHGTRQVYDFLEDGVVEALTKINTFKTVRFASTGAQPDPKQLKQVAQALARLDVPHVAESLLALVTAVRQVGERLVAGAARSATYQGFGLPTDPVLDTASALCEAALKHREPAQVLSEFLSQKDRWVSLHEAVKAFAAFIEQRRDKRFATFARLLDQVQHHSLAPDDARSVDLAKAAEDVRALVTARTVVAQWSVFEARANAVFEPYRDGYREAFLRASAAVRSLDADVRSTGAFAAAEPDARETLMGRWFGELGSLGAFAKPEAPPLETVDQLLAATARQSLGALVQVPLTVLALRERLVEELDALPPPPAPADEDESVGSGPPRPVAPPVVRTYEWRPQQALAGRAWGPGDADALDRDLDNMRRTLHEKLSAGYRIVVRSS